MGGQGSGGHNAVSIADHLARGTFRPARHAARADPPPAAPVTSDDRARVLDGLAPEARRLAAALLDEFTGWDPSSLMTLRLYAQSAERLAGILDDDERRRETRAMLGLLKALQLERPR